MVDLPVRKLFGVGPKLEEKLQALNIQTCSDLHYYSREHLVSAFGIMGHRLYELARGIDERPVNPERIRKSISVEETYLQDLPDVGTCLAALPELITRLQGRIERAGPLGIHNVFVKLKFSDFQQTTVEMVHERLDVAVFSQLIHEGFLRKNMPVRLVGIGIKLKQHHIHEGIQLPLFEFNESYC